MLAGEQAAQLELIERGVDRRDRRLDLGLLALVVLVTGQLVEHLDVVELLREPVEDVEVVTDVGVLGVELLGPFLVVPQAGSEISASSSARRSRLSATVR